VACGDKAPIPDMTAMVGAVTSEVVAGDGSLAPTVGAVTSSMAGEAAFGSPAASTGLLAGVSSPQP
jgi:hypothetical protein